MNTRSLQEWVHWLEIGAGGRWVRGAAIVLGVVLLSLRVGYTQFHGPVSEVTLAQAVVGRQLAEGHGFTTSINYPQVAAWRLARGEAFDPTKPFPELHQPPLYSMVVAGVLKLFPEGSRMALFSTMPKPPDGFRADYVLLVLNIVLLWLAAWQTYVLGRRLFDEIVGVVAALGLLLSAGIWSEAVAVNGTPLMMVLVLALFGAWTRAEMAAASGRFAWRSLGASGLVCGFLFLCDYAAGIAVVVAVGWCGVRFGGAEEPRVTGFRMGRLWFGVRLRGTERLLTIGLVAAGFLVVAGPWMARNIAVAGNPVGLAWQGFALKAGDPTAEPSVTRATLSAVAPVVDLNKIGNKGLTALQASLRDRLWSGGSIFFAAFFVAGLIYRFREESVDRLRWLCVVTIAALVVGQAFFDSGEGERHPLVYAAPLMMIFGAGFFAVLVASNDALQGHAKAMAAVLLLAQALPLARDVIAPRRGYHFSYPPYYPGLFLGMRGEMTRLGGAHPAWMADVPAGAAWYSGQRVWAQPATLRDFYRVCLEQPQVALVLTPHTLDRPFFLELSKRVENAGRLGDWAEVYPALLTNRFPVGFPLSSAHKWTDNIYVLIDPLAMNASSGGVGK